MEVYTKKANGRYESLGHQWSGFPADGVWLVKDGTQNCILHMKDIGTKPKRYIEMMEHQDDCSSYIMTKSKEQGQYSVSDLSKWAAEFYAELLEKREE